MRVLLLIDGNNLAHRMHHQPALAELTRADGKKSGVFQGVVTSLHRFVVKFRPAHMIVVFDGIGGAERRKVAYPGYKEHRRTVLTGAFQRQLKAVKFCLASLGVGVLERDEAEADDLIWQLARVGEPRYEKTIIVSRDADLLQCVTDRVWMYDDYAKLMFTPSMVAGIYRLTPAEIPWLKALEGDASDGVRGVPGIGRVKGIELIHRYRTVDKILAHLTEDQQDAFTRSLAVVQLADDPALREVAQLYLSSVKPVQPEVAKSIIGSYNCAAIMRRFDGWLVPFHQLSRGAVQRKD